MADKLCCNCLHYIRRDLSILDRCSRVPIDRNVQYVRDESPEYSYCTTQRARAGGQCGPEGRLFAPAPLELKLTQDWRSAEELEKLMEQAMGTENVPVEPVPEGLSDAPA